MKQKTIILTALFILLTFPWAFAHDCPPAAQKDAAALVQKGLVAEADGMVQDALLFYRSALNACPDLPGAHFRIGAIACRQETADQAQIEEGIGHLEAYLSSGDVKNQKHALRYLFHLALAAGDLKKAADTLNRFNTLAPGDPFILYARSMLAIKGKRKEGIGLLQDFVQNPKADPMERRTAERELINIKYQSHAGSYWKALELYDAVEKGDRSGKCINVDQCLSKIKKLLEPMVARNPDFTEAALLLGKAYAHLGANKDFKRAESYFQRAGDTPEGRIELIKLYNAGSRSDQALSLAEATARDHPDLGAAHYWRGCLLLGKGSEKEALKALVKAFETESQGELAVSILRKIQAMDPQLDQLSWVATEPVINQVRLGLRELDGAPAEPGSEGTGRYGKPIVTPDQPVLEAILSRVVKKASLPPQEYEIVILDSPRVQALADGTGHKKKIFMTKGFLDFVRTIEPVDENSDVLAFAVAHELAHLALGHHRAAETLSSALPDSGAGEKIYSTVSRAQEFEADQKGLYYAYVAGYNPNGALDFMDAFARRFREVPFGADHPSFTRRSEAMIDYWKTAAAPAYHNYKRGIKKIEEGLKKEAEGNPQSVFAYDKAKKHFQRFLQVFENTKEGHNNLGFCHLKIAQWLIVNNEENRQGSQWRLSMAYDPNLFRFRDIGFRSPEDAFDLAEELKQAQAQFQLALQLDPSYPEAYLNEGCLLLLQGREEEARLHFDRGVNIQRVAPACLNNLGVLCARGGDLKTAEVRFENARRLDARLPEALYNLTVLYKETGREGLARQMSTTYLEVDTKASGWRSYITNLFH